METFQRELAVIGEQNFQKLQNARVTVFGIGGVGSFVAEALVRAGIGHITFVDGDVVAESNCNRQLIALHSTVGKNKAAVMKERALDINPDGDYTALEQFFTEKTQDVFDFSNQTYVADCIDSVRDKVLLLTAVRRCNVPVISAMGAGNKMNPSAFRVTKIEQTRECPLAKIMRHQLKVAGVHGVKAVWSDEKPMVPDRAFGHEGERLIGSISFVPSSAGLLMASEIVKDILKQE